MTEPLRDWATLKSKQTVSPVKRWFVFVTLLIGAAITVSAAKLEVGIFKPLL